MKGKVITKGTKRRLRALTLLIVLLIGVIITSTFSDLCQIIKNKNDIVLLTNEYNDLLKNEESLHSEITKLQDSDYVARYAREKFLYSLPDEIIIKLPTNKG